MCSKLCFSHRTLLTFLDDSLEWVVPLLAPLFWEPAADAARALARLAAALACSFSTLTLRLVFKYKSNKLFNTLIVLTVNEGQVTLIICGLTKTKNVSAEVIPGCCMSFTRALAWPFQATQPRRRIEYCMRLGCGWRRDTAAAPCPQMPHHGKGSLDSPQLATHRYTHTHTQVFTQLQSFFFQTIQ